MFQVLIDAPGQDRRVFSTKQIALTSIKIDIKRGALKTAVTNAWKAANVDATFGQSGWGKKLARRAVSTMLSPVLMSGPGFFPHTGW